MKNKCAIIYSLLIVMSSSVFSGNEDRSFESERLLLVKKIRSILIDRGQCDSLPDCQEKKFFFAGPYDRGVSVQVWGVRDDASINMIVRECQGLFLKKNRKINIVLTLYKETKVESLNSPFWRASEVVMAIEYKGDI